MTKALMQTLLVMSLFLIFNTVTFAEGDGASLQTEQHITLILNELNKLNIKKIGKPIHHSETLPEDLMAGASWAVKSTACRAGGYEIEEHTGLEVDIATFAIQEPKNDSKFLKAHIVTRADRIVCVYKSNQESTPGIYRATKNFLDPLDGPSNVHGNGFYENVWDDANEPEQGAMIPCEICVVLYPEKYEDKPKTCPVCGGAKEHFQAAQMMTKDMADERAKDIDSRIKHIYSTTNFDDPKSDGFPHKIEEIRDLQHQRLIHALVYDEIEVEAIVKKIHELDEILGSSIGAE